MVCYNQYAKRGDLGGIYEDTLEEMAKKRGFLLGRGMLDTERMAKVLIDEFRSGKLGRMTLDDCEEDA